MLACDDYRLASAHDCECFRVLISSDTDRKSYLFEQPSGERALAMLIALLVTLLVHYGVYLAVPEELWLRPAASAAAEPEEVELAFVEPEALPPELLRFVEASPEAPENEPDRQDQYSYRATQAADEATSDSPLEAPNVDGETDSQKILQGELAQVPPTPPGPVAPVVQPGQGPGTEGGEAGSQAAAVPQPVQPAPAPDFLKQEAETEEGPGSRLDVLGEAEEVFEDPDPNAPINVTRQPQPTELAEQVSEADGAGGAPDAKPVPRARPRLNPELITGPLMNSRGSASRRGSLSLDASFSEFGEYEQQFYAALQIGWYQEIEFFQPLDTGASVMVRFLMRADGAIENVRVVQSNASTIATEICTTAISKRSPFRPWTREMIEVFGTERTLTVRFNYR